MHLDYETLAARLRALPPAPTDAGTVTLVVARPAPAVRVTPARAGLTPEGGLDGDRWSERARTNPQNQITVMRTDVARLIADGQPIELTGDNLLVELDLSSENLPAGTRLQVGTAQCEVTALPHDGCAKFAARFGNDARRLTGAEEFRSRRLRGLHLRVLEPGEVAPGDPVRVLSRPAEG
jgi:MOSC domain-containing protein YiiM